MVKQLSTSPDRHRLQRQRYVDAQTLRGRDPSEDYLGMFDHMKQEYEDRFSTEESRKNNLEYDLRTTDWILEKVRASEGYAQNLYAALCNNSFLKNEPWIILKNETWHCSWRYAGGIVADMQQTGDYLNWYCSGIRDNEVSDERFQQMDKESRERYIYIRDHYVDESVVTEEIRQDLLKLGWTVIEDKGDK